MKKLLLAVFAAASLVASAQSTKQAKWAIDFPEGVKPVEVTQTFTPFFKIDNEERVVDMRKNERDMNLAKHWLAIDVTFATHWEDNARWPKWLDDVQVEVNIFLPTKVDDKGNFMRGKHGLGATVKRPGYPEAYRRELINRTGTKLIKPAE